MNPYTSMWTGVTPGDGPQEVHVVLLDNGRTRALADEVGRQALRCIRCSACLNVCPVYERIGGHAYGSVYPGPIGAILTPLLRGTGPTSRSTRCPTPPRLCGACFDACPVLIDIPEVLVHLRAQVVDRRRGGPAARCRTSRCGPHRGFGHGRPPGRSRASRRKGCRGRWHDVGGARARWATGVGVAAVAGFSLVPGSRLAAPAGRVLPRLVAAHPRWSRVTAREESARADPGGLARCAAVRRRGPRAGR